MKVSRRSAVKLITLFCVLPTTRMSLIPTQSENFTIFQLADRLFSEQEAASRLGKVYLEHDHNRVAKELRDLNTRFRDNGTLNDGLAEVLAWIREDFRQGRTVWINGWQLSRIELQLCAALVFFSSV